jgi:hypothetical protein
MHRTSHVLPGPRRSVLAAAPLLLGAVALGALALAPSSRAHGQDAAPAASAATEFDSKEDAAKALVAAAEKNDDAALTAMAGGAAPDVVLSGTDPQVQKDRAAFAAAAKKKLTFEESGDRVTLVVGDEAWPFPIPLVKSGEKWRFDAAEGREEIRARRIGRNELRSIRACREFVAAQVRYASKDRDGDKVREYAQRLISAAGQQDGLWWAETPGGEESPLGDALAPFKDYVSNPAGAPAPFMGYYWRILGAQGPNAPGGAHTYVINGNMIAGCALLGVPAVHGSTGVMSLMVSHHGTIYQKDLGPSTLATAQRITAFDPDATWTAVPAEDLAASTAQ